MLINVLGQFFLHLLSIWLIIFLDIFTLWPHHSWSCVSFQGTLPKGQYLWVCWRRMWISNVQRDLEPPLVFYSVYMYYLIWNFHDLSFRPFYPRLFANVALLFHFHEILHNSLALLVLSLLLIMWIVSSVYFFKNWGLSLHLYIRRPWIRVSFPFNPRSRLMFICLRLDLLPPLWMNPLG